MGWFAVIFGLAVVSPLILITYVLLSVFFKYTFGKWLYSKRKELRSAGEWAVVTGAAGGIGLAFCKELAKEGLKIFMVDGKGPKLKSAAKEVEEAFGVETRILELDPSEMENVGEIRDSINALSSVACYVNNAFDTGCFTASLDTLDGFEPVFFLRCMEAVLPKLSEAAYLRRPFLITIKHPNAFVRAISDLCLFIHALSLRPHSVGFGVRLQTYLPCLISTEFSRVPPSNPFVPSADIFAAAALDMLGVEKTSCGYFYHALQYAFPDLPQMLCRFSGGASDIQMPQYYSTAMELL